MWRGTDRHTDGRDHYTSHFGYAATPHSRCKNWSQVWSPCMTHGLETYRACSYSPRADTGKRYWHNTHTTYHTVLKFLFNLPSFLNLLHAGLQSPKTESCGITEADSTDQMPFLSTKQQCQTTEEKKTWLKRKTKLHYHRGTSTHSKHDSCSANNN